MSTDLFLNDARRLTIVGIAYFAIASITILLSRFDGGFAHIWAASAFLTALLMRSDALAWWKLCLACAVASLAATGLAGFGWLAAPPLAVINIAESLIGAGILRLMGRRDDYLATLPNVGLFLAAAGVVAPGLTAVPSALVAAAVTGMPYSQLWRDWFASHTLGMLVFAPLMTMFLRNEVGTWARALSPARRLEVVALVAAMAGVSYLTFGQEKVPLLFMPMLPMIIMTFRLDRVGAAMSVVILVTIGTWLTAIGHGPLHMIDASPARLSLFLQVYFAVSVLTVLPVAAELRQRKELYRQLRESEARYKLITDSVTDIVLELDITGMIRYVSPSVREITGFAPEQLIGKKPQQLVSGPDARAFLAAHRKIRSHPGSTSTVEYRAQDARGTLKWFEANTRGIFDDDGALIGSVSAIRDISERKSLEIRLAHAASTDALTGLGNRRAFDALLDRQMTDLRAGGQGGCIAIFDIDFFKRVNDQHGHASGDRVLEAFARTALTIVRPTDYVARLGGEEFGVILSGVDVAQAERICDRLRAAIAGAITPAHGGAPISVTVSAGIAAIQPRQSRDQLMRAADAALYRAKAAGRDRLAIAA